MYVSSAYMRYGVEIQHSATRKARGQMFRHPRSVLKVPGYRRDCSGAPMHLRFQSVISRLRSHEASKLVALFTSIPTLQVHWIYYPSHLQLFSVAFRAGAAGCLADGTGLPSVGWTFG